MFTMRTGVAAAAGAALIAVLPAGAVADRPGQQSPPGVTVHAPERIGQELTVWDVGFDSTTGRVNPAKPDHVAAVSARISASETMRDVRVTADGPGTFSPVSATRWESLPGGSEVTVSWRWTAPLRSQDPPDSLTIRVLVQYQDASGEQVTTGQASVATPPPAAPRYDTYVSDLPFDSAFNGYGPVERDRNNGELNPRDGGPIRLDGVTYPKGIGLNARGVVGVHLGGNCTRFTAVVGIDDGKGGWGSVIFRVIADGRVIFDSDRMTGATAAKPVDVDVTGVRKLKLVADPTADGQAHDWADWAAAHLACGGPAPGAYRLVNVHSGQCLDVKADSREPGANILQWTCDGAGNQRFDLTRVGGAVKLTGGNSGLCVGVAGSVPDDGGNVIQWTCSTSTSQNWRPVSLGRGAYALRNASSGKCLEVHQASTEAGANVQQWTCNGGAHQSWRLDRLD